VVQIGLAEDGKLFKQGYTSQMTFELDGQRPINLSAVVGGNAEEGLSFHPIVVDGKILLGAQE